MDKKLSENLKDETVLNTHCRGYFSFLLLNYIFYKTYNNIFGSQISLLVYLSKIHEGKVESLIEFYNQGKLQNQEIYSNIKFEAYLGFLVNNDLIKKKNECYNITPLGRDFLKFLDFEKLPNRLL